MYKRQVYSCIDQEVCNHLRIIYLIIHIFKCRYSRILFNWFKGAKLIQLVAVLRQKYLINSDNFDSLEFLLKYEITTLHLKQKVLLMSKISRASLYLSDGKIFRKFGIVNIGGSLLVNETKLSLYYCLMFNEVKAAKHRCV